MRQVGFAAARGAHQQQVMAARCCQGQSPCRQALLHAGLRKRFRLGSLKGRAAGHRHRAQQRTSLLQLLDHLAQVRGAEDSQFRDQGRFLGIGRRHDQGPGPLIRCQFRQGDHAAAGPQAAVQSQFSGAPDVSQPWLIQLAAGG